MLLAISQKAQL